MPEYEILTVGPSYELQLLQMEVEELADEPWGHLRLTAPELEAVDRMRADVDGYITNGLFFGRND